MKRYISIILILSGLLLITACTGKGSLRKESKPGSETDTTAVPDTGYTGIKKYYSGKLLVKEVTFKNGVRDGEMKTYYQGGQLYQTFWYKNGLREDSARWYYLEGQVFRSTPYKHDTVDGIQKQYYRNGKLKAKIYYVKGKRSPLLEEYTLERKLVGNYPDINYTINDNYKAGGKVRINLELTDKQKKVRFYRGEFTNGVFDSVKCIRLKPIGGKNFLDLKKTGTPQKDYVGVIAVILTDFGNNFISYKKIDLPYQDLK